MKRINKTFIGAVIGLIIGYLVSHYLISPFIFGTKADRQAAQLSKALDCVLDQERASIPLQVDEITKLIAVDRRDFKVAYTYSVDLNMRGSQPSDPEIFQKQKQLCQNVNQNLIQGIEYDYIYKDLDGNIFLTIPVNPKVCFI